MTEKGGCRDASPFTFRHFVFLCMPLSPSLCYLCPRQCGADHSTSRSGFCAPSDPVSVASVCIHKGEEPVIGGEAGVCNLFFYHCNLQCIFCQNEEISNNHITSKSPFTDIGAVVEKIKLLLPFTKNRLGFVSPSHCVAQVIEIVDRLHCEGIHPVTIYNSNGYDSVSSLQMLAPYIDIWLPDFKYSNSELAQVCSGRADYPLVALEAIREMYRQKGSLLLCDEEDMAFSGLLVRHLVLPGFLDNSRGVLQTLSREISPSLSLSLMAQYHPPVHKMPFSSLERVLTREEYETAKRFFAEEGFFKGFFQDCSSHDCYLPSFQVENPFTG